MILFLWAIGGLIGYAAAQRKGFSTLGGVIAGVLLGPLFAWLLFFVSGLASRDEARRRCPSCAEWVQPAAVVCKHCHRDLVTATSAPAPPPARTERQQPPGLTRTLVWLNILLALLVASVIASRAL